MLRKKVLEVALFMLLASFGSCDILSFNVDTGNLTEAEPSASMRIARNTKIADRCMTTVGFTGTCLSRFNCMRQGGVVSGFCGTYGVCCETNLQCGATSRQKITTIRNPVTLPLNTCPYLIEPYNTNVCQLHIYFERFSLEQPTTDGFLQEIFGDHLAVNGLTIYGDNEEQHIYVPFNVAGGMDHVQLVFNLPNRRAGATWRLVVTQLECPSVKTKRTALSVSNSLFPFMGQNSLSDIRNIFSTQNSDLDILAPPGCLQYYTARDGVFRSFNYNNFMGPYLANMNYAICFKRSFSDSLIQFTANNFELSKHDGVVNGIDADCHPNVFTPGRRADYLMIPQAMLTRQPTLQPTYFCGTSITSNDVFYSAMEGPFVVYFSSDEVSDATEKGFQFTYRILQQI